MFPYVHNRLELGHTTRQMTNQKDYYSEVKRSYVIYRIELDYKNYKTEQWVLQLKLTVQVL